FGLFDPNGAERAVARVARNAFASLDAPAAAVAHGPTRETAAPAATPRPSPVGLVALTLAVSVGGALGILVLLSARGHRRSRRVARRCAARLAARPRVHARDCPQPPAVRRPDRRASDDQRELAARRAGRRTADGGRRGGPAGARRWRPRRGLQRNGRARVDRRGAR